MHGIESGLSFNRQFLDGLNFYKGVGCMHCFADQVLKVQEDEERYCRSSRPNRTNQKINTPLTLPTNNARAAFFGWVDGTHGRGAAGAAAVASPRARLACSLALGRSTFPAACVAAAGLRRRRCRPPPQSFARVVRDNLCAFSAFNRVLCFVYNSVLVAQSNSQCFVTSEITY